MSINQTELTADQKSVVLNEAQSIIKYASEIISVLEENKYQEDLHSDLMRLPYITSHNLLKNLNLLNKDEKEQLESIQKLHQTYQQQIKDLEAALLKKNPTTVKEQLNAIDSSISNWWSSKGFKFIEGLSFLRNGVIELSLGFSLRSLALRFSDNPVSDKENEEKMLDQLSTEGYAYTDSSRKQLLDCDQNRKLLTAFIKETFPSCTIHSWKNRISHSSLINANDQQVFELQAIKLTVDSYEEINQLLKNY